MAASSCRRCFLAIGIQNYSSPLDQLKNAASDAASVETLFQQLGYRTNPNVAPMMCFRQNPRGSELLILSFEESPGQKIPMWSPLFGVHSCPLLAMQRQEHLCLSFIFIPSCLCPAAFFPPRRTQLSCHLCNIQEVRAALQKFSQLVREDSRWKNKLGACFIMDEE